MNYYEHHLGDYLRDTAHLSMLEDGAYRRLLDAYYIREQPLPSELRDVYRLVRAASKQDREAVGTVLREFFEQTADGWKHRRCESEIAHFRDKRNKARSSAEARWNAKRTQCEGNANACADSMRTQCEGNAPRARPQTPDTSNPTPSLRSGVAPSRKTPMPKTSMPEDFEISARVRGWAAEHGHERLEEHLAAFRRKVAANGYRYIDWDAAFMEAVREDWAKLNHGRRNGYGSTGGSESSRKLSAVERVRLANGLDEHGDPILAAHGGNVRPQVDESAGRNADGAVVEGDFRVVERADQTGAI